MKEDVHFECAILAGLIPPSSRTVNLCSRFTPFPFKISEVKSGLLQCAARLFSVLSVFVSLLCFQDKLREIIEKAQKVLRDLASRGDMDPKLLKETRCAILFFAELSQKLLRLPECKLFRPAMIFSVSVTVDLLLDTQTPFRSEYLANATCALQILKMVGPTVDEIIRTEPSVTQVCEIISKCALVTVIKLISLRTRLFRVILLGFLQNPHQRSMPMKTWELPLEISFLQYCTCAENLSIYVDECGAIGRFQPFKFSFRSMVVCSFSILSRSGVLGSVATSIVHL